MKCEETNKKTPVNRWIRKYRNDNIFDRDRDRENKNEMKKKCCSNMRLLLCTHFHFYFHTFYIAIVISFIFLCLVTNKRDNDNKKKYSRHIRPKNMHIHKNAGECINTHNGSNHGKENEKEKKKILKWHRNRNQNNFKVEMILNRGDDKTLQSRSIWTMNDEHEHGRSREHWNCESKKEQKKENEQELT